MIIKTLLDVLLHYSLLARLLVNIVGLTFLLLFVRRPLTVNDVYRYIQYIYCFDVPRQRHYLMTFEVSEIDCPAALDVFNISTRLQIFN